MTSIVIADSRLNTNRTSFPVSARTVKINKKPVTANWKIQLPAKKIIFWTTITTAVIIALGLLREYYVRTYGLETIWKDLGQIALDSEGTLAVWFSSLLMVASSLLLFAIAALTPRADNPSRPRWIILGILFTLMSLDETVSFHETTMAPLRQLFDLGGALHFSWVVIAVPVLLVLSLYFLPFLLRLPWRYAVAFAASGMLYVGGALGMEFVGGYFFTTYGEASFQYMLAFLVEESLEMIGLTCFLAALFNFLKQQLSGQALSLNL